MASVIGSVMGGLLFGFALLDKMADPEQALRGDGIFFQAGKSVVFAVARFKFQSKNGICIGENEVFIVLAKDRPIGIVLDSGEIELDFIAIFVIQDIAGVLIEPGDGFAVALDVDGVCDCFVFDKITCFGKSKKVGGH